MAVLTYLDRADRGTKMFVTPEYIVVANIGNCDDGGRLGLRYMTREPTRGSAEIENVGQRSVRDETAYCSKVEQPAQPIGKVLLVEVVFAICRRWNRNLIALNSVDNLALFQKRQKFLVHRRQVGRIM